MNTEPNEHKRDWDNGASDGLGDGPSDEAGQTIASFKEECKWNLHLHLIKMLCTAKSAQNMARKTPRLPVVKRLKQVA